ncbi:hypothetical protein FQN54_008857 [Arachnomyces sp. PD_36]|nr:hypothetical protein FQN54_008857 [Arachnomyces sp. PD_36]
MSNEGSTDDHRDAREVIRLVQCPQCSRPFRTPLRLPCGNTICRSCMPSVYKRENITYPLNAERKERFRCPFIKDGNCKDEEHSIGDCGVDVTLSKIVDIFTEGIEKLSAPGDGLEDSQAEDIQLGHEGESEDMPLAASSELCRSMAKAYMLAEVGELNYSEDTLPNNSEDEYTDSKGPCQRMRRHVMSTLRNELDCLVCYALMLNPLTMSCGHTFCRNCVARVLDHSNLCPICRRRVQRPKFEPGEQENGHISKLISKLFPGQLRARQEAEMRDEDFFNDLSTIPLFVCTLAFPMMPVFLHVFEPRYRLMIRRVLEHGGRKFGMVMFNRMSAHQGELGVSQFTQYGTLLHIDRFELLPDGRSLIEARGVSRFKVLRWEMLDGYYVGKTERVEDVSLADEENLEVRETEGRQISDSQTDDPDLEQLDHLSTEQLMQINMDFVSRKKADSAPWLHPRLLAAYGQPPSDPAVFPYWFGCVLPIFEEERYSLLPTTSVRERLKITSTWVRVLDDMDW